MTEIDWSPPCPAPVRCADQTFCPPACQQAGNREGNHRMNVDSPDVVQQRPDGLWEGAIPDLARATLTHREQAGHALGETCPDCPLVACRHCGDVGAPGEDHTCPCPYSDHDCPDHPDVRP